MVCVPCCTVGATDGKSGRILIEHTEQGTTLSILIVQPSAASSLTGVHLTSISTFLDGFLLYC